MQNAVIFVDAGYLFRAAADSIAHRNVRRRDVQATDVNGLIANILTRVASQWDGDDIRLLRAYWYDGAVDGVPSPSQIAIGELPRVKLRLGRVTGGGQKGVDGLIILDLITLARNHAADLAIIVSGDEDLRETVAHVQSFGVTAAVVGFPRSDRQGQSILLLREADHVVMLHSEDVETHFVIDEGAGMDDTATVALSNDSAIEVAITAPGADSTSIAKSVFEADPAAPPVEEAAESLRLLCDELLDDPRFQREGVADPRVEGRLRRYADKVLVGKLHDLTGEFPVPPDVLNRARALCMKIAEERGSKFPTSDRTVAE